MLLTKEGIEKSCGKTFVCITGLWEEWVLMGDVNVSLNLENHSEGISHFTQDMIDIQECINKIEMKDISSTGFHYT